MTTGILKILDVNGLSYLYGKLKANIDAFQANSTTDINAAISNAETATAAANTAAEAVSNIEVTGAVKGTATTTESGAIVINTAVSAGTAAPTSLADGEIFCVYE